MLEKSKLKYQWCSEEWENAVVLKHAQLTGSISDLNLNSSSQIGIQKIKSNPINLFKY